MIITKQDVNLAFYYYGQLEAELKLARRDWNELNNELRNVKLRSNNKGYQAYKASTLDLRKKAQQYITDTFIAKHEAHTAWHGLRSEYNKQNKESNKEQYLQNALKKLSFEEEQALKEYFNQ